MERYEQQIRAHLRPLERYVLYHIENRQDAEDVLQEVLIAAYKGFDTHKNSDMLKAWLIGIAKNKCNDYYRRRYQRAEVSFDTMQDVDLTIGMHGVTTQIAVRQTLETLKVRDKQILYLHYFRDMKQTEIAKLLHIPVGTVKSRLSHAKQQFKEQYANESKGESNMQQHQYMPEYLPDYRIEPSEKAPFAVRWEELMGWFIVPKLGESVSWAMYDFPKRKRSEQCDMRVVGKAVVHGVEGVEIEAVESDPKPFNRADGNNRAEHRFVAQLTDTHCRYLAESHVEDGVRLLHTFLDGDEFLQNWGFDEDNCGNAVQLAPKGIIEKHGNVVTTQKQPFMLDIVGRFTVSINGKAFDTVCVIDAGAYEEGVISEQYLDQTGRTVLWRRFNREDWMKEQYRRPWSELLPENERLTVDGETYVHWYDCITDYIL